MFRIFKKIFNRKTETNFPQLLRNGAQIVDVRTREEYRSGHINEAINVPLQELTNDTSKIKKTVPVITCCASGMRSASAKNFLQSKGFEEVYNGGGWTTLQQKIKEKPQKPQQRK